MAVSEYVRKSIVHFVGESPKLKVVHNVVDGDIFRPQGHRRVQGQILFVGAVRYVKGVDVLFHALPRLRQQHPEVRLILVGEPFFESYRREAQRLVELARGLGIDEWVDWVGSKTPQEVAQLMGQSSVVVLPSRAEAFPAVLIEAIACGTPVVATRCGGPEEVVTPQVGHLVPPEDPAALADALGAVLEHVERYDAETLRSYALDRYAMPIISEQIRAEYLASLKSQVEPTLS